MNMTQIKTVLTPLIVVAATWLASKFPLIDQATWNTLITSIAVVVISVVTGLFTKTTELANTVGSQPGTTVVTTPELASATSSPDVIAATPEIKDAVRAAT